MILYPSRVIAMKPYFSFLGNASALWSAVICSFNTMEQVSRTYIPSLAVPITQRARRLHAVILYLLPLDSHSFQPLIIYIEENLRPSRFSLVTICVTSFSLIIYYHTICRKSIVFSAFSHNYDTICIFAQNIVFHIINLTKYCEVFIFHLK